MRRLFPFCSLNFEREGYRKKEPKGKSRVACRTLRRDDPTDDATFLDGDCDRFSRLDQCRPPAHPTPARVELAGNRTCGDVRSPTAGACKREGPREDASR